MMAVLIDETGCQHEAIAINNGFSVERGQLADFGLPVPS